MVDRLTMGPVQIWDAGDVMQINDAFRQVCERIDGLKGLSGRAEVWDRVRVDDPTDTQDALTLGDADLNAYVTRTTTQTITGQKTFNGVALRVVDSNGTLIHALGTKV